MKRLKFLLILLLAACAAPMNIPEDSFLDEQAPPGEFVLKTNLTSQWVTLQSATVRSLNRLIL